MDKSEFIEQRVGDCRFNSTGDLEQLVEVKVFEGEQLVAVEARWQIVPTVS